MKKKLQSILVCPLCKGPLLYKSRQQELICETDKLAYPVRNGIPVLLNADARKIEAY
ncbi:MAG: Trm112 family protein [Gammaproteobacteria bacterium]|nr:Trm112 family protein [Gammaproteobacteria bacterium]